MVVSVYVYIFAKYMKFSAFQASPIIYVMIPSKAEES